MIRMRTLTGRSLMLALFCAAAVAETGNPREEQAIRSVLGQFYEGWNAHDPAKMTAIYADDVDHINTRAEWHKGKAAIHADLVRGHAPGGRLSDSHKVHTVEKIRFLKPDVAVVQVRSISKIGNIGTYVMTKQNGRWLVVSFTNVEYPLPSPEAARKQ
jgi:uncharacterized protein (TIGR02246 family)